MFNRVLVPVDLNDAAFSDAALKLAEREVKASGGELHLITVVQGFSNSFVSSFFSERDHQSAVQQVAKRLKEYVESRIDPDLTPVLKVFEGSAAESINRYINKEGMDLVILRAHQRNRVDEFLLGSVSARVVERAYCSVMVLKGNT